MDLRNDLKIGMAIGGVLLLFLIAYLVIVPQTPRTPEIAADTPGDVDVTGPPPIVIPDAPAPAEDAAPVRSPDVTTPTRRTASSVQDAFSPSQSIPDLHVEPVELAHQDAVTPGDVPQADRGQADGDAWLTLFSAAGTQEDRTSPSVVRTPVPGRPYADTSDAGQTPEPFGTAEAAGFDSAEEATARGTFAPTETSGAAGPGDVAGQTHTVQAGDSFYTIAEAYFGDGNRFRLIERANPNVDSRRLRPGQVLRIPLGNESPGADAGATARPTVNHGQYEVRPGDTLSRIAAEVYGDAGRWNDLYAANRQTIGDNPATLRVGTVLDVP